jgi:hypothetical protein
LWGLSAGGCQGRETVTKFGRKQTTMAVSVQIVSKEASDQLSMKYLDLAPVPSAKKQNAREIKRLTLQSFLVSNYANSPRRRLSLEDLTNKVISPGRSGGLPAHETQRRQKEFFPSSRLNEESTIISLNSVAQDTLRNCLNTPSELMKKNCTGLARSKTCNEISWKYKVSLPGVLHQGLLACRHGHSEKLPVLSYSGVLTN